MTMAPASKALSAAVAMVPLSLSTAWTSATNTRSQASSPASKPRTVAAEFSPTQLYTRHVSSVMAVTPRQSVP